MAYSVEYVFHFDIYSSIPQSAEFENFGFGGEEVLNLQSDVETPADHVIYFDNFFTSINLLHHLKNEVSSAAGKIRENRMKTSPLESVKCDRKKERYNDVQYEEKNGMIIVR